MLSVSTTASRWDWNLQQTEDIISLSKDLKAEIICAISNSIVLRGMSIDITISDATDKIIQKILFWWVRRANLFKKMKISGTGECLMQERSLFSLWIDSFLRKLDLNLRLLLMMSQINLSDRPFCGCLWLSYCHICSRNICETFISSHYLQGHYQLW